MDLIVGPSPRRIAGLGRGAVLAAGLAAFLATGCFTSSTLQGSSESSSKSSGSFSDSSGSISRSSSGGGDESSAYHRDVRESAASVAAAPADAAQLEREIGVVASQHDVLDWERDAETYREIGRGLADAGVAPERFDALAGQLAHGDERRRALIEEGFRVEGTH